MIKNAAIVALIIALVGSVTTLAVIGQDSSGGVEIRVNAKRLDDGRTEFAVQQREGSGWSDRIAPRGRYLPAEPPVGRWLNSTPVIVGATTEQEASVALLQGSPLAPPRGTAEVRGTSDEGITYAVSRDGFTGAITTSVTASGGGDGFLTGPLRLKLECTAEGRFVVLLRSSEFLWISGSSDVSLKFDDGFVQEQEWQADDAGGYSPYDDIAFVEQLDSAERLTILMPEYLREPVELDVRGMVTTPVQPNLDSCGSAPGGV